MKISSPDSLFSLSFPNFRFLVPFGHYIGKRCTSDGPLEFDCTAGSLLLNFFLQNKKDGEHTYEPCFMNLGEK